MKSFWDVRRVFVERISPQLKARCGLDVPEVFLLEHITLRGLGPTEIAEQMRLPPHAISRRLDGLEKQGYLERSLDPEDARRRILTLTPLGKARYQEGLRLLGEEMSARLSVLDEQELQVLLLGLERLSKEPSTPKQPSATN